jgi:hypothetical protein
MLVEFSENPSFSVIRRDQVFHIGELRLILAIPSYVFTKSLFTKHRGNADFAW